MATYSGPIAVVCNSAEEYAVLLAQFQASFSVESITEDFANLTINIDYLVEA